MAGGLVALLDDVAVLARAAAASVDDVALAAGRASVKAAGVVVDDTAVTPQYVHGLAAEGVEASVWDVRCVKPLDPAMIDDAAGHPAVVTIEDGFADGGAGAAMAQAISSWCIEHGHRPPPVSVLGVPLTFLAHGKPDQIHADLGLDAAGVAASARAAIAAISS